MAPHLYLDRKIPVPKSLRQFSNVLEFKQKTSVRILEADKRKQK